MAMADMPRLDRAKLCASVCATKKNVWEDTMLNAAGRIAAALSLCLFAAAPAHAQYPTRAINLIVPAAAGGPTDAVARLVAQSMSRTLGQQVVVENVGGAGGTIGMARVAKSAPDGSMISVWHIAQATAPSLYPNLQYSVIDNFD